MNNFNVESGLSPYSARQSAGFKGWHLFFLNSAVFFAVCCLLRFILWFQFRPESTNWLQLLNGFTIGAHLDLFVSLLFSLPLLVWFTLIPPRWIAARWHQRFVVGLHGAIWAVVIFLFFVEYYFFEEFKSRFNTVAVDYLLYPTEVGGNIWESYPVVLLSLTSLIVGVVLAYAARKLMSKATASDGPAPHRSWAALAAGVACLLIMGLPIRFSQARFSQERLLNEIANNGQISFINAILTRHLDYQAFYRTLSGDEAVQRVLKMHTAGAGQKGVSVEEMQRDIPGNSSNPRLNVVLLVEESLGSEFWGVLGGGYDGTTNSFTPCMDALTQREGLLFTNLYASGNRTIRGLEGMLASFPPLPGDSIVARDKSDHIETIASVLKRDGYDTLFVYGGRSLFDNMGKFTRQNGYDRFIEQKDFEKPVFTTSWGVCDEDLFDRLLLECRKLHSTGRSFLATSLSVSNHKPYTYPTGRIPEDPNKYWRHHAVKYADYALGRFFEMARKEAFYTNTIFVVVADHGARVYGRQTIPMHSYRIPMLVVGPAVVPTPVRNGVLGGSLDVAPTILGLINRPYQSVFFGQDLLRINPEQGRALVQHNRDIGMLRQGHLIVLGMNKTIEYYHENPLTREYMRVPQPDTLDREVLGDTMAIYQLADHFYVNQQYWVRSTRSLANTGGASPSQLPVN